MSCSIVDIDDFDIRNLTFNKINPFYQARLEKEGKDIQNQYSIYAKYEGKPLCICLTIDQLYGGQMKNKNKSGKEFCDINSPNIKFNIGLNPALPECVKLKEIILAIEKKVRDNIEYLISDELKAKGKVFKKYIFSSAIKPYKVPSQEDPDVSVAVEDTPEHYGNFTLKYDEEFGSNKIKTIFETNEELEDGTFRKYNTLTKKDIAEIPIWKKKVRILFKLVRIWVSKNPSQMFQGCKAYGIVFKLIRVHIFDTKKYNEEENIEENASWMKGMTKKHIKHKEEKEDEKEDEKEEEKEKVKEITEEEQIEEIKKPDTEEDEEEEIIEESLTINPN